MKQAGFIIVFATAICSTAHAQHSHQNLLQDGNAELGVLYAHDINFPQYGFYTMPGWTASKGNVRAEAFADDPTGISYVCPGPQDRGALFFFGGTSGPTNSVYQTIDLTAFSSQIASGTAAYSLSGWLGGFSNQGDSATITIDFRNSSNSQLSFKTIGPVTAAQRNNITEALHQVSTGIVPKGSVKAIVTLNMTITVYSANNAWIDNASLAISVPSAVMPGDFNFDGQLSVADMQPMITALADPAIFEADHGLSAVNFNALADVNGNGVSNYADVQCLLSGMKSDQLNPVPEPSGLALCLIAALSIVCYRVELRHGKLLSNGHARLRP